MGKSKLAFLWCDCVISFDFLGTYMWPYWKLNVSKSLENTVVVIGLHIKERGGGNF